VFENVSVIDAVEVLLEDLRVFGVLLAVEQPQFRLSLHETQSVRHRLTAFKLLLLEHVEILDFTVRNRLVVAVPFVGEYLLEFLVDHLLLRIFNNFI
jgi:hypothetical protein